VLESRVNRLAKLLVAVVTYLIRLLKEYNYYGMDDCTSVEHDVSLRKVHGLRMIENKLLQKVIVLLFFRVLAPCRLIGKCQRFEEIFCLYLQG
jgi:hypothetical protein